MTGRGQQDSTLTLASLVRLVAGYFCVDPEELSLPSKGRRIVRAKAVICYVAVGQLRIKGVEIAEVLGYRSTAVTHAATRGGPICGNTPELAAKLAMVKL